MRRRVDRDVAGDRGRRRRRRRVGPGRGALDPLAADDVEVGRHALPLAEARRRRPARSAPGDQSSRGRYHDGGCERLEALEPPRVVRHTSTPPSDDHHERRRRPQRGRARVVPDGLLRRVRAAPARRRAAADPPVRPDGDGARTPRPTTTDDDARGDEDAVGLDAAVLVDEHALDLGDLPVHHVLGGDVLLQVVEAAGEPRRAWRRGRPRSPRRVRTFAAPSVPPAPAATVPRRLRGGGVGGRAGLVRDVATAVADDRVGGLRHAVGGLLARPCRWPRRPCRPSSPRPRLRVLRRRPAPCRRRSRRRP